MCCCSSYSLAIEGYVFSLFCVGLCLCVCVCVCVCFFLSSLICNGGFFLLIFFGLMGSCSLPLIVFVFSSLVIEGYVFSLICVLSVFFF